ncbi:phage tail protein [Companilactobacillus sp. DQM5]|uniref:phage tail protein n=1 Tax=Companilactobacillus sp. DQM5 TaxID=3463359 RepID=UPI004057FB51
MTYTVNFKNVETTGVESSPVAEDLAGLRANEARYFWNKYKYVYKTEPASEHQDLIELVETILKEKDIYLSCEPLEVTNFTVEGTKWIYVFYENGLVINVLYTLEDDKKRAVGIKLTDGMEIPEEFVDKFKFARQKSKLAGVIRGSYFVIKQEYDMPSDF